MLNDVFQLLGRILRARLQTTPTLPVVPRYSSRTVIASARVSPGGFDGNAQQQQQRQHQQPHYSQNSYNNSSSYSSHHYQSRQPQYHHQRRY